jgi:hypothetical protein
MSFTYSQLLANLANMLVVDPTNADYIAIFPTIIDDAEQSIYRGLDLLNCIVRDTGGNLTANSRTFNLPQTGGRFVGTESMNVFTPVGTQTTRNQLVATTREFIDAIYGNEQAPGSPSVPQYYAPITDQQFIVGPSPDAAYTMEVIGWIRPTPLSAANPTTYLTLYLPDLFFCECLIFGYGYLKDFGATTDDPQASASWVSHYKGLWDSANTEENRKKYASQGWTAKSPAPLATPPRA